MGEMRLCFFFNSVFVEYVEQKFLFLRVGLGLDNLVLFLEIRVGLFVFVYLYWMNLFLKGVNNGLYVGKYFVYFLYILVIFVGNFLFYCMIGLFYFYNYLCYY